MSTILDSLIYDRTQADIDALLAIRQILLTADPTSDEFKAAATQFIEASKGAYNSSDLNRVSSAIAYLAQTYHTIGYTVPITAQKTWTNHDIPTRADMAEYLSDITALRNVLPIPDDIPAVPTTMSRLTYETANDIERILAIIGEMLNRIQSVYIRAGMPWAYAGNSFYVVN